MIPIFDLDMSDAEYRAAPGVHVTTLKQMLRSPHAYRYAVDHPREPTPAMRAGSALDVAVLTPGRFDEAYVIYDGERKGKAWQEFKATNSSRSILTASEAEETMAMKRAVQDSPFIGAITGGNTQVSVFGELRGHRVKARLDHRYLETITDLKKAKDGSPGGFGRQAWSLGYLMQAAFYSDLCETASGRPHAFRFLVVEGEAPYAVSLYNVGEECMRAGREQYTQALDRLAVCEREKVWPGYSDRMMELQLPRWANQEIGLEDM